MIEVRNLFHSYENNDVYAVNDVSFSIAKGEILGFLGPSGAGKSTTQGVLSGLLELQKGEIIIDGAARLGKPDKAFFNRTGDGVLMASDATRVPDHEAGSNRTSRVR